MTMTTIARRITGGVDTHLDVHVAAALDERGALLGVESFATNGRRLSRTARAGSRASATVELVGVEGHRQLWRRAHPPPAWRRGPRRRSRPAESSASAAPRKVRSRRRRRRCPGRPRRRGERSAKTRDGNVEAMRVLRVARSSARRAAPRRINQMRSLISTAPESSVPSFVTFSIYQVLKRCSAYRPAGQTRRRLAHQAARFGRSLDGPSPSKKRSSEIDATA